MTEETLEEIEAGETLVTEGEIPTETTPLEAEEGVESIRDNKAQSFKESYKKARKDLDAKAEKQDLEQDVKEVSDDQDSAPETTTDGKSDKEAEKVVPPYSWDKTAKSEFRKYPDHAQAQIAKRVGEMERGFSQKLEEVAHYKKQYQQMDHIFEGREKAYALNGITKSQVVGQLLAAQDYLDENPAEGLKWIAQSYGLNLADLANGAQSQTSEVVDPAMAEVRQELAGLKGLLNQQTQAQTQTTFQQSRSLVQQFAEQKTEDGSLRYPYLGSNEFVNQDFLPMLRSLKAANPQANPVQLLDTAYNRSVRLNDSLYSDSVAQEVERKVQEREAKKRERTQKARGASGSISGSPGSKGGHGITTVKDALTQAMKDHAV